MQFTEDLCCVCPHLAYSYGVKARAYIVRNISSRRSKTSGLFFRVGYVRIRGQLVMVFENPTGGWLTADPENFL